MTTRTVEHASRQRELVESLLAQAAARPGRLHPAYPVEVGPDLAVSAYQGPRGGRRALRVMAMHRPELTRMDFELLVRELQQTLGLVGWLLEWGDARSWFEIHLLEPPPAR